MASVCVCLCVSIGVLFLFLETTFKRGANGADDMRGLGMKMLHTQTRYKNKKKKKNTNRVLLVQVPSRDCVAFFW